MNVLTLPGPLTGSMTGTPGLAAVDSDRQQCLAIAYATVCPVAMVILVVCVQLLNIS